MKLLGIYPGNFQPPTRAHFDAYKRLKSIVGSDTFIATTDRSPTPEAPLNYGDKEQIWVRHGIPASHIRKVDDWKNPIVIVSNFSRTHTKVIYSLNLKESEELMKRKVRLGQVEKSKLIKPSMHESIKELNPTDVEDDSEESEEDPEQSSLKIHPESNENKEVWLDSKGNMNYFQPYKGNEHDMRPLSEHGYVLIDNDTEIEGKLISTANIRQALGSQRYDDDAKKKFFRFVFGWFDVGLYTLMTSKFRSAHQVSIPDEEKPRAMPSMSSLIRGKTNPQISATTSQPTVKRDAKSQLQKMVREMLGEILDEEYSTDINTPDSTDNMTSGLAKQKTPAQQKSDAQKQKVDLVKKKQEAEAEAKKNKQQRDQYATTVKSYDNFQKKNDRDKLGAINKQLSQKSSPIV